MIVLLVGLLLAAVLLEVFSLRHGTDRISCRISLSKKLVEPEEPFLMRTAVENRGRMMAPFLKLTENLPRAMTLLDGSTGDARPLGAFGGYQIAYSCYLAGRQKLELSRRVFIGRRGRYGSFGGAVYAGDFLGVSGKFKEFSGDCEVVVKPRRAASASLLSSLGGYLGEISVRRFWIEDPMFLTGYREYTGREPMRSISWTMTARTGDLMVKEFDHTAEPTCAVICDISTRDLRMVGGVRQEQCFSLARTVCEELEARGFAYSFLTNSAMAGADHSVLEYPAGMGKGHLDAILEVLGRASGYYTVHLDEMLRRVLASRSHLRGCILITLEEGHSCEALLRRLEERTRSPVLVLTPESGGEKAEEQEADAV